MTEGIASGLPSTRLHGIGLPMMTASKNPFADETPLETTLADASMLKPDIFYVLGKQLYTENKLFTAGEVHWQIATVSRCLRGRSTQESQQLVVRFGRLS